MNGKWKKRSRIEEASKQINYDSPRVFQGHTAT